MRAVWLLLPLALFACSGGEGDLMPLEIGNTWTYSLNTEEAGESLETLKIERRIALGEELGYELSSGTGRSVLAWHGGQLLASELAGTRYEPALILIPSGAEAFWEGEIVLNGERHSASATISRRPSTYELKNQTRDTVLVEHSIQVEGRPALVVATHYAPGTGILEQRQTLDGDLVLRMGFESGP